MTDIKTSNSDIDICECNSWTVLCECGSSNKPDSEKCNDCKVQDHEVFPDLVIIDDKELFDDKESKRDEDVARGAPNSASENFSEHEMIQQNECGEKCSNQKSHPRCKSRRKRRGKSKVNEIGNIFIIGTVLAITGASFLCLLTPKNVNLGPSNVSQLQANCSKLGIVKDVSRSQLPIKAVINKCGSKLSILDKDGTFQTCITHQGPAGNSTNWEESENFIGPLTYEQFQKKVDVFNKQYGKPTLPANQVETDKQARKAAAAPVSSIVKTSKASEKTVPLAKTTKKPSAASISSSPKAETRKENKTLSHCKILCNVLQDLALLRLTQVVSKQLADKAAKRKKKVALKPEVKKKSVIKRPESLLKTKKRSTSSTALTLWEELPFNHEIALKSTMTDIAEEEEIRKVESKMSLTDVLNTPSKYKLEKHRRRQMDYLEKLKQEHNDRMAHLKGIRERQQQSIQALIQERKQDFNKLNMYSEQQQHIMEGKRRLLEINDYYRKLKSGMVSKSTSDFKQHVISNVCPSSPSCRKTDSIYSLSNIIENNRNTSLNSIPSSRRIKRENEKLPTGNSSQYLNMRKKYYEQISSYWTKREEYLNERINFMKDVSGSLKEVMGKFRNDDVDNQKNKEALVSIINEASLAFPDNENLEKFKSQAHSMDCASLNASSVDARSTNFCLQLNRYCSLHNFHQNRQCTLSASRSNMIKNDSFYCEVFGKKGNQIRKRDLAVWRYSRFQKMAQNEFTQHYIKRKHLGRKSKKELKQPDPNTT